MPPCWACIQAQGMCLMWIYQCHHCKCASVAAMQRPIHSVLNGMKLPRTGRNSVHQSLGVATCLDVRMTNQRGRKDCDIAS